MVATSQQNPAVAAAARKVALTAHSAAQAGDNPIAKAKKAATAAAVSGQVDIKDLDKIIPGGDDATDDKKMMMKKKMKRK